MIGSTVMSSLLPPYSRPGNEGLGIIIWAGDVAGGPLREVVEDAVEYLATEEKGIVMDAEFYDRTTSVD